MRTRDFQYTDVERLARAARGPDPHGNERGFEQLVAQAASLARTTVGAAMED